MQTTFKQISKQVNKIIRILTKVSEQYPKISKEIDLALYASIKIQKIVNKYWQGQSTNREMFQSKINQYQITKNSDSQDAFFTTAMQTIQNFKNSTFKLERKINVLINEQDYKTKKPISNQPTYPATQSLHPKNANHQKQQKKRHSKRQAEPQISEEESQSSRNLRSLDQSIIKIVNEIKQMQGEKKSDEEE